MREIIDARGKRAYRYTRLEMAREVAKYVAVMLCATAIVILLKVFEARLPGYSPEMNVALALPLIIVLGVVWSWAEIKIRDILYYNREQDAIAEYEQGQDECEYG